MSAALCVALCGVAAPAQAQWLFGAFGERPPAEGPAGLSPRDVRQIAAAQGLRLLTRPYRNGNVYVVDGLDRGGNQDRLIIDGDDGTVLQRFRVQRAALAPRDPDPGQGLADDPPPRRGLFGFFQDGSPPPVPSENVPGDRARPMQGRPLAGPSATRPAFASTAPDPNAASDLPPAAGFEKPKTKPKRQVRARRPEQNADLPVTPGKVETQPVRQPELVAPPPAKAEAPVAPAKSVATSQPTPPPAAAPPPRVPTRKVPLPSKPAAPLNDIPPAPLD